MPMSNYLEKKLLDHVAAGSNTGSTSYSTPVNLRLAFYTTAPTQDGGGVEVTGGSYVRMAIVLAVATSGAGTGNNTAINVPAMPACTVVAVGIFDSVTTGNLLWFQPLATPKTYTAGQTDVIPVGGIGITID